MTNVTTGVRIEIKNLLYLTDFSEPSEAALPFATAIARKYGAGLHALHVVLPVPYVFTAPETIADSIAAEEEVAEADMLRLDSRLNGVPHETIIERGPGLWSVLENAIKATSADMIVLGTHGRTGAQKFLLGSVAEEVFRRSPIPVLTIGPQVSRGVHNGGHFRRILFATDFSPEAAAAAPYAISLAQENQARLLLVHVVRQRDHDRDDRQYELSVAEAIHHLYETVPDSVRAFLPSGSFGGARKSREADRRSRSGTQRRPDRARRSRCRRPSQRGNAFRAEHGAPRRCARCLPGPHRAKLVRAARWGPRRVA